MRPRQGIVEVFSTFLKFDADNFSDWATDPRLRRNMQTSLARLPQSPTNELFWALYWYKLWQTQPVGLAQAHLSAYLQEVCYWAVQKTIASVSTTHYTSSDYFQMAIARVDKVLKGFNPQSGFSLRNYASAIFSSVLKEILRQQHEVNICTNWSLLRKLSRNRLEESLQNAGLNPKTISSYILAWDCFKTLYVPLQPTGTCQLPKPDRSVWEAITELYNVQRSSRLDHPAPECRSETIEKWMLGCAKAARAYLYPTCTSLNAPKPTQPAGELLDNLPEFSQESLLTQLIEQEEQQSRHSQQSQINSLLIEALTKLEPQAQKLLQMYYGQEFTQQQIATQLKMRQYTVSRRLAKAREALLLKLASWSKELLHISLASEVINYLNTVLEEWLKVYYRRLSSELE